MVVGCMSVAAWGKEMSDITETELKRPSKRKGSATLNGGKIFAE
jgi:hypothetical protein